MVGKISGLATLVAGGFGLGAMVQGAVDAGESIYQLSTRMGISAGEGAELSRILKLTGGDTQSFATAMMRLDKSYTASGEAGDKVRAVLEATGVSLADSNGKLLPLNQQLEQLSKGYNLAAASGQQEEFIMNTLGARGMSLIGTLKDYAEAKEAAARVQGVGLDPAQMHELNIQMKTLGIESSQVGLAFTSALAPVAQEIFPPIMSGMKSTAAFLAENKTEVIELTKDALELAVAYKSIQLLASASNTISTFWQAAATEAAASTAIQAASANELSAAQERSITRAVAASNRMYAKMEADAVKTANTLMVSAEETQSIIAEKCVQISTSASAAAEAIRTQMTEAFLTANAAAVESTTGITEALTLQGEAATITGGKMVAANEMSADSARTASIAQGELAAATALPGDAAIVAGEKTVGAMATAEVAVRGLLASVWALMGGWIGLIAIMGYGAYKAYEYGGEMETNYEKTYGQVAPVNQELNDGFNGQTLDDTAPLATEEQLGQGARNAAQRRTAPPVPVVPKVDLSGIGGMDGTGHTGTGGKSEAEKELEKLQKEAEQVNKEIDLAYQDVMDNKIQKVDDWYNKEKEKLDASASANERYTEELGELDTVYAEKKRKAYAEMLSNSTNIWVEAAKSQRELNNLMSTAGITGVDKQRLEIQNKYNDSLKETEEEYKKLSAQFMGMDTESQTQYLLANKDVTKNDDGSLNFSKRIDSKKLAHKKEFEQQMKDLHYDSTKYQETLDLAYSDRSMSELQALLNSDAAMQDQYRTGQTAAMKEYYDLWAKTHRSKLDEMAEASQTFDQGLESIFTSIGKGVNSAGDLVKSFGSLVLETIWKIKAEQIAANITMSIFGNSGTSISASENSEIDKDLASGNVGNLVVGYTGSTGGAVFGPGTGTSDSVLARLSNGEYVLTAETTSRIGVNNLDKINRGYATGGLVTGPSLSSMSGNYSGATVQSGSGNSRNSGGVQVVVNNNSNATVTATDDGMSSDGMRQIIVDIATDGVLNKLDRSPAYARNVKMALGGA